MARITVAIPTYNRASLVERAARSALAQDHDDFEVIVFDNASTDDTVDRLERIGDSRLRIVTRPATVAKRQNINDALHAGAASEYTTVLFSDDVMFPVNLRKKNAFLEAHPEVVAVHSAHRRLTADGRLTERAESMTGRAVDVVESPRCFLRRSFRDVCRVWFSSAVMRSSVASMLELRDCDAPADDNRFWLEAALHGSIGFIDEPLNSFGVAGGVSTDDGFLRLSPCGADYLPTVTSVVQPYRIRIEFLVDHDLGTAERWLLRAIATNALARDAGWLVDVERALGRTRREALAQLMRCLLAEPLIGCYPWPWLAALRREPHPLAIGLLHRADDLRPWEPACADPDGGRSVP